MWNLPKPDIETSINEIDDVIAHSNNMSPGDKQHIETLYREYDSNGGSISTQRHSTVPYNIKSGLKTAYPKTYKDGNHYYIRQRLVSGITLCPICSIGRATTLDHHLPQSLFEALSVCGNNLVPMCRDCNWAKNASEKQLLHPYYDQLPVDRIFLNATIIITQHGGIHFKFTVDANVLTEEALFDKLNNTIEDCELDSAFNMGLTEYVKNTLYGRGLDNMEGIKTYIKGELKRECEINGLNHWKTAVLRAIVSDPNITLDNLKPYL
ncbi:MAG: hypothetical protein K2M68_05145 [Muribaculaceae bacterium]|nr:hypothetical protein [Muribaculaceae bacterium]